MFATTTVVVVLGPGQIVVAPDGAAFVQPTVYGVWYEEIFVPDEELDQPNPFDPLSTPFGALPTGGRQLLALMGW